MTTNKKNQPSDEKIEKMIIGCFLNDANSPIQFIAQLNTEMFLNDNCKDAIMSIQSLVKKNSGADLMTVLRESRALNLGCTALFLNECYNLIASSQNLPNYIGILKDLYVRRELLSFVNKVSLEAINLSIDPLQLISIVQKKLNESADSLIVKPIDELKIILKERVNELLNPQKNNNENRGIVSGFVSLDEMLGGRMYNGSLLIIAGRPGQGKTTLALNIARNASIIGGGSGVIFSLEMAKEQLTDKFLASESSVSSQSLTRNIIHELDKNPIIQAEHRLSQTNIFIEDSSSLTPMILRSKATNLKIKHDIKYIIVDYLQLMNDDNRKNKSREQEISEISRSLKILAKDLNVPVIALSQLSRSCESRPDKRPILSDLRESGSIEQDADAVLFVFRPEYYKIMHDSDGNSLSGKAEIIFAKNRNGETGTKMIECDMSKSIFFDLTQKSIHEGIKEVSYKMPSNVITQEFPF